MAASSGIYDVDAVDDLFVFLKMFLKHIYMYMYIFIIYTCKECISIRHWCFVASAAFVLQY